MRPSALSGAVATKKTGWAAMNAARSGSMVAEAWAIGLSVAARVGGAGLEVVFARCHLEHLLAGGARCGLAPQMHEGDGDESETHYRPEELLLLGAGIWKQPDRMGKSVI